ncbi:NEDD8-conjugating enzyme Ubc12-like, partial [Tropilaelaps mercedesae]
MIRLFQTKNASKDGTDPNASKRTCAAQLRINKDVNELELPPGCHIEFPDKNDFLNFRLSIAPDQGFYKGGRFMFTFKVPANYPHDPPKVHCETRVGCNSISRFYILKLYKNRCSWDISLLNIIKL